MLSVVSVSSLLIQSLSNFCLCLVFLVLFRTPVISFAFALLYSHKMWCYCGVLARRFLVGSTWVILGFFAVATLLVLNPIFLP